MRNEVKLLLASGIILALFFTSIGCIGTNDHDKDDDDKIDPTDLPNNGPQQQEGTLKDIDFHIEIEDNTLVDGKFNVACSLKNTDMESHIISGPGLGFPTLDFIIYTPEDTIIHFLGPWVRCRCLPDNIELPSGIHYHWTSTIGGNHQVWGEDSQDPYVESYAFEPGNYIMYGNYTSDPKSSENNTDFSGWTQSNILNFTLEDPQTTSNDQLKCEPEVKVTGYNYTSDPESVPFQEVHSKFADNYTGLNLSTELRNLTIDCMAEKTKDLSENATILKEAIKVTYYDWEARPYRIPCYAEMARYNNDWIWAIGFNRANGFEDGLEHFDLYFVSISAIQAQYISGCNSTAIVYQFGCD